MRLWVMVFEGDWVATRDGAGRHIAWWMSEMWQSSPSWQDVDEAVRARCLPIDTTPETPIGELAGQARKSAQASGLARTDDDRQLHGMSLASAVTHATLDDNRTVADADLTDGDLVVLRIEWEPHLFYSLKPATSPRFLFETLQLAANAQRLNLSPRLWGALLYTD